MPSVSKQQQKFMGIVRAIQKGDAKASDFSKKARDAAKKMKKKDVKKFASTKHDGLPRKIKQEILDMIRNEIEEGFGGELKGLAKKQFEKDRLENAEVFGYELAGVSDIREDGHTDVASAKRAMKLIAEDAVDMFKKLKSMDDEASLPSWWMNKIAICKTYMNTSRDYLDKPNENITEYDEQALGQPLKFSNTEAEKFAKMDVQKMGKAVNQASFQAIKMMMNGVKAGKYDAFDLIRAIKTGPAKDASTGVRDFLQVLWNKSRDGFRRYSKNRGKLR